MTENITRNDIAEAILVSKDEALSEYKKLSGFSDVLNVLDDNPFPNVVLIKPVFNDINESKTKDLVKILNLLKVNDKKIIILCEKNNKSIYLSSRNVKNINTRAVDSFSTYDIVDSNFLLSVIIQFY